jgi:Fe-S-cluster containining protein
MVDLNSTITKKTPLRKILNLAFKCKKCGNCCSYSTGFLVGDDSQKIAKFLKISENELKEKYLDEIEQFNTKLFRPKTTKKPFGPCVFLKNEECSIQKVKPLHCRIGNCNEFGEELSAWFTLNYLVNAKDPESIRQYKLYIESGGKIIKGGRLQDLVLDKNKLKQILEFKVLR